jgi:hypothetical protein
MDWECDSSIAPALQVEALGSDPSRTCTDTHTHTHRMGPRKTNESPLLTLASCVTWADFYSCVILVFFLCRM